MFKSVKATTVKEYMASVQEKHKEAIAYLHAFIQKASPTLKPHLAYNMLGYGSFPYKNYKKESIQWPIVALASQKHYISVYVCALEDGKYLAEKYKKELSRPARPNGSGHSGGVSVGKSCIRFKKLEDVHLPTLKKVIQQAAKHPGLVAA